MNQTIKKMFGGLLAMCVAAVGLAAVAAPSVTVNSVTESGTWSTIAVKYTLSGVDTTVDYKVQFDVTADGVTKTTSDSKAKKSNTSYTKTIDTKSLFGSARRDAKAKVKVSLIEVKDGVQLWAGGPYFAECNVGASKPEEYGYYFWWGDTVGYERSGYSWVSVKDGMSSIEFTSHGTANQTSDKDVDTLKKSGWIDNSGNLTAAHDAARVHLGGSWRMPTADEYQALIERCKLEWTEQNGVKGCKVTGNTTGYMDKSIFLPAAGNGNMSSLDFSGFIGHYWSSTPCSGKSDAFGLDFQSNGSSCGNYYRYCGKPVRPVQ